MRTFLYTAKAFSEPCRVRIIAALRLQELCVCELCDVLDARQSTLSTHLRFLLQSNLVRKRIEGKWAYYSLEPGFRKIADSLFRFFQHEVIDDRHLAEDQKRLEKRLTIRKNGTCCLGFKKPKRHKAHAS